MDSSTLTNSYTPTMLTTFRALITTPLLLALVFSQGGHVYAQNVTSDVEAALDVNADLNGDNSGTGSDTSGSDDTTATDDHDSDKGSDDSMGAGVHATVGAGFNLSKDDASVRDSSGSQIAAESVNTESDLEAYAASTLRASNTIENIDAGSDELRVKFKEPARFLWFIPFEMTSTVTVNADGSVSVNRPWYSFLASVDGDVKSDIESRVRTALENESGLTARSQARVLAALSTALDGSGSATAQGSLDANASAGGDTPTEGDDDGTADQGSGDVAPN